MRETCVEHFDLSEEGAAGFRPQPPVLTTTEAGVVKWWWRE